MKRRWIGLGIAAGAACFGLGVLATRTRGEAREAPEGSGYVIVAPADAGVVPRIVFDPASIQLLPDASLRLELPPGFDGGAF